MFLFLFLLFHSVNSLSGNCIAGGSGYGVAFDANRADTIGLHWTNLPKKQHTVEYWFINTDIFRDYQCVHSYSAYNVNGKDNSGGEPYEAANEVQLAITPQFIRLWRGSFLLDLKEDVNGKAASYSTDWRHYAYSIDPSSGEVAFYLDGEMLDLGSTDLEFRNGTAIDYEVASCSSNWIKADHPDATDYYGTHLKSVEFMGEMCTDMNPGKGNILLLVTNDNCTVYEQAKQAAEAGAWAVVFQKHNDTINSIQPFNTSRINIPVILVNPANAASILSEGEMVFNRFRQSYQRNNDFNNDVQNGGVLHLGQEADKPWGDFDEYQAANAIIDEYRVWNIVRTPEEIKANFKRTIDMSNTEVSKSLNIYWKFDDNPDDKAADANSPVYKDYSGSNNHGLAGNLPTIENQIQYATGRPKTAPTAPLRIPSLTSPIVGDGEVVVVIAAGEDTTIELKSLDPDRDDLITKIVTLPDIGNLFNLDLSATADALKVGDIVIDRSRTENKRVTYRAPDNFENDVIFMYSVEDGDDNPKLATVRLMRHHVEEPITETITIKEDTLAFFALARPSQLTQRNMKVKITKIPVKGQLFQAQFDPNSTSTYTSLAKYVGQYGPMTKIDSDGAMVVNNRGIVLYQPAKDESSITGELYDSFRYKFVDDKSGMSSTEGVISMMCTSVNDAPVGKPAYLTTNPGSALTIQLEDVDVDFESMNSFAEHTYGRIVKFPKGGDLCQYDSELDSHRGVFMGKSTTIIPKVFSWASRVVRYSSQFSLCGDSCFSWKNPICPSNDVLSGGKSDGMCSETAWHSSNILGPPDVYPGYNDAKKGWDLSSENHGQEWIELEFPFDLYIDAFDLYETYKPGALWKISTTEDYIDDTEKHCGITQGSPPCEEKTKWRTLWAQSRDLVSLGKELATITVPPLCPSTAKTRIIRLDLDTKNANGWNNFDAVKLTGYLTSPPGLIKDASKRIVYVPNDGVHGYDKLLFRTTDCLDEGEETEVVIQISSPNKGEFSGSIFASEIVLLEDTNDVRHDLDMTAILDKIHLRLLAEPSVVGTVWHTTASGVYPGIKFHDISLENPSINILLGAPMRGYVYHSELWLEDRSNLTFRILLNVSSEVPCVHGQVQSGNCFCTTARWTYDDCSVEVIEDTNPIPSITKFTVFSMCAFNMIMLIFSLIFIQTHADKTVIKMAQPFFLYLVMFGCALSTSSIIPMGIEENDIACVIFPWLYSVGFCLTFGALFAKIWRIYMIFKNGTAMRRKPVTIKKTLKWVSVCTSLNVVILISWTVLHPLQWVRTDDQVDTYGYVLSSNGRCESEQMRPYLCAIGTLQGVMLICACWLSYVSREIPTSFSEGRYVALAVASNFELYLLGIPVLIIVGNDANISFFVRGTVIFLNNFVVIALIFGRLMYAVYCLPPETRRTVMAATRRQSMRTTGSDISRTRGVDFNNLE